jgi:hypothetical protein
MWPICSPLRIGLTGTKARPPRGGAEARHDGFDAFVEKDADALTAVEPSSISPEARPVTWASRSW